MADAVATDGIPKELHVHLLRNDVAKLKCTPMAYVEIISWDCTKRPGETIEEYLLNHNILENCGHFKTERQRKDWIKKHKMKLMQKDFSTFDVTFLHDLLPVMCFDKVCKPGTPEHELKINDSKSVESLLQKIKRIRNEISHEISKAVDESLIEKLKLTMAECLQSAGKVYGKSEEEMRDLVRVFEHKFEDILENTLDNYHYRVRFLTDKLRYKCLGELRERYNTFCVPLPDGYGTEVDSKEIFHNVKLSIEKRITRTEKSKITFSSTEICNFVTEKFAVINGVPGSGKTTFMRLLFNEILLAPMNEIKSKFDGVEKFSFPIFIECRTETCTSLGELVRESFPEDLGIFPKDEIYAALGLIDGLIFIIDGYDEVDEKSKLLVNDIIKFCSNRNTTHCIVSGRVSAANEFEQLLFKRSKPLKCNSISIEPIACLENKVNFLIRYAGQMTDCDARGLERSFRNQTKSIRDMFSSPVLLVIYCTLFTKESDALLTLKNEESAYEAIFENYVDEIKEKLVKANIQNPRSTTQDIIDILSRKSFKLFKNEKYFFNASEYLDLVRECKKETYKEVDVEGILSCILTPEYSVKFRKVKSFQFPHSSIMEYFAVKQIYRNLEKDIDDNSSLDLMRENGRVLNFLHCLALDVQDPRIESKLKRYRNILKLLILVIYSEENLLKYAYVIARILSWHLKPSYFIHDKDLQYCLNLLDATDCDEDVARIVAVSLDEGVNYHVTHSRHVRPLCSVLEIVEPSKSIDINLLDELLEEDEDDLMRLFEIAKEKGHRINGISLRDSYDCFKPVRDELFDELENLKFSLDVFVACVTSTEQLSVVRRSKNDEAGFLSISTSTVTLPQMNVLEGFSGQFDLMVEYTDSCPTDGRNSVPNNTNLRITDVPNGGQENVFNIIRYLAPKSKLFGFRLELLRCSLCSSQLEELAKRLQEEGYRTASACYSTAIGDYRDCPPNFSPCFSLRLGERPLN